ncbi:DUF6571 family protein [Kitasatospora aburaviensis]
MELQGLHDGTSLGADPLDEVLGVMGRQPEAATSYLDPGADGGNKRLHFLLKEREWPQGYITGYTGMIKIDDPLAQSGLAAAIEAASTGERAGTAHDGKHSEAQARIMHDTIVTLDEDHGGDKVKATLRQPLANALADYVGDTHELLNGRNDVYNGHTGHDSVWKDGDTVRMAVGQDSLVRFMRGLSDDPAAYGTLHRAETGRIDQELAAIGPHPTEAQMKDPMGKGAAALGVFDAIRADTAMDMRDDKNAQADWKAKVLYHTIGAPITPIAPLGDAAQRLVDTWTYAVSLEEKDQNNSEANAKISDTYLGANRQMSDMVGIWARDRGMDPDSPDINPPGRHAQQPQPQQRRRRPLPRPGQRLMSPGCRPGCSPPPGVRAPRPPPPPWWRWPRPASASGGRSGATTRTATAPGSAPTGGSAPSWTVRGGPTCPAASWRRACAAPPPASGRASTPSPRPGPCAPSSSSSPTARTTASTPRSAARSPRPWPTTRPTRTPC